MLSGYATGIVYALSAIPIAYVADTFKNSRVWVLSIAALWWSLCVIFQSLSHNFWQIFLARIGMGLGQSCVEPLSISLISDLSGGWRNVFIGESAFYVGVYIGEAISGQIATAFTDNDEGWRIALRAIGITGTYTDGEWSDFTHVLRKWSLIQEYAYSCCLRHLLTLLRITIRHSGCGFGQVDHP